MLLRTLLIALILSLATGCASVKNWFGSSKNKASEPAELVEIADPVPVRAAWSRDLGKGQEKLGLRQRPAIEGERVFVSNDEGRVLALDINTGKTVWDTEAVKTGKEGNRILFWRRQAIDAGLSGSPGVGNGLVVIGGRNGEVVAFDADSGAERWRAAVTSEVLATPLITGGLVIVRSNDGRTFGLDAGDGTRKWVFDRGLPGLGIRGNGSPVAGNGLAYLGYDDGSVIALRLTDGQRVWEQLVAEPDGRNDLERMADVDGEIQVGFDALYASSYKGQTMAIDTSNGRPLWNRDAGGYGGIALLSDRLVLADRNGTVWALDRSNGSALWKQDVLARRQLTSPAVHGDYAVFGDLDGYLHWIRIDNGTVAARTRIERARILGTPQVAVNGMLIALTNEGKLSAFPQPN